MKVKAGVCHEFQRDFAIQDVWLDDIHDDEILVDIKACAICHSDLAYWQGKWGGMLPAIYGHEAAGKVAKVGDNIKHIKVGDNVIVTLIRGCDYCYHCHNNEAYYCSNPSDTNRDSLIKDAHDATIHQALNVGGFAERVIVRENQVIAFPDFLSYETASLIACGVITGFGGAVNTANITFGETVAVVGLGGVGMNAVQGARIAGAGQIIAIDTEQRKCVLSKKFGATEAINPIDEDVASCLKKYTHNIGVDCMIICVGNTKVMQDCLQYLRPGGRLVLLGMPEVGAEMVIDPGSIAGYGWQIIGSKMGSSHIHSDIPKLFTEYQKNNLLLDELISNVYSLDELNKACHEVLSQKVMRNIISLA